MSNLRALAPLAALLAIAALLPPSAAQQGVSWSGYAVVSPGPVLLSLAANVSSAPVTLSLPVCGNATGYWAYEGSEPLAAYLANGSVEVPVLQPGLVNVTIVESGCVRQLGAVYEAWVYMPGPGLVIASNGTAIVYFEGNATPLGPQELVSGGGNVTVFLAVNKTITTTTTATPATTTTSTTPTPTVTTSTTSTTTSSTATTIATTTATTTAATTTTSTTVTTSTSSTTSTTATSLTSTTSRPTPTSTSTSLTTTLTATTASTSFTATSVTLTSAAQGGRVGLMESVAIIVVLAMVAAVVGYLAGRR